MLEKFKEYQIKNLEVITGGMIILLRIQNVMICIRNIYQPFKNKNYVRKFGKVSNRASRKYYWRT